MGKPLKFAGAVAILLFGVMQFMRVDRDNGRVNPADTIEARLHPPPAVEKVLSACRDCHTEETHWRWYQNVAPVLWLMAADVYDGRAHMDLSRWAQYNPAQQADRLQGMCKFVRSGDMPLWYYKPLHPGSWMAARDWRSLCDWTDAQRKALGAGTAAK